MFVWKLTQEKSKILRPYKRAQGLSIFLLIHHSMRVDMQNYEFCCIFVVMQGNSKYRKRKALLIALFDF